MMDRRTTEEETIPKNPLTWESFVIKMERRGIRHEDALDLIDHGKRGNPDAGASSSSRPRRMHMASSGVLPAPSSCAGRNLGCGRRPARAGGPEYRRLGRSGPHADQQPVVASFVPVRTDARQNPRRSVHERLGGGVDSGEGVCPGRRRLAGRWALPLLEKGRELPLPPKGGPSDIEGDRDPGGRRTAMTGRRK